MKMKHNKKRNTAILYEVLTQQLTKAIVENNPAKKSQVSKVILRYFNQNTVLGQELELYKALYETRGLEKQLSQRLVQEVTAAHARLDKSQIYKEQSALIGTINKQLSKEAFKIFVPNYKSLASIAQLFDPEVKLKNKVLLEQKIVEYVSQEEVPKDEKIVPIDNLVYRKFVEKFNDKYSDHLLEEQKELLSKYISSFADNGLELKMYLNEEIGRLHDELVSHMHAKELQDDKDMLQKAEKVVNLLEVTRSRPVDISLVRDVAKVQSLVKELQD